MNRFNFNLILKNWRTQDTMIFTWLFALPIGMYSRVSSLRNSNCIMIESFKEYNQKSKMRHLAFAKNSSLEPTKPTTSFCSISCRQFRHKIPRTPVQQIRAQRSFRRSRENFSFVVILASSFFWFYTLKQIARCTRAVRSPHQRSSKPFNPFDCIALFRRNAPFHLMERRHFWLARFSLQMRNNNHLHI